jgi:hypothetical protein
LIGFEYNLKRVFGRKRQEVTGDCRGFRKEGHHNLYSSPNIAVIESKETEIGHESSSHGRQRNSDKILAGKYEGKRNHVDDLVIEWKIILKLILQDLWGP